MSHFDASDADNDSPPLSPGRQRMADAGRVMVVQHERELQSMQGCADSDGYSDGESDAAPAAAAREQRKGTGSGSGGLKGVAPAQGLRPGFLS